MADIATPKPSSKAVDFSRAYKGKKSVQAVESHQGIASALLALDALPVQSDHASDSPVSAHHQPVDISGQISQSNVSPAHSPATSGLIHPAALPNARRYTAEFRVQVAAEALPLISGGATVNELAAGIGIPGSTLAAWLLAFDEPGYRAALSMQVAAKLTQCAVELESCAEQAHDGVMRTEAGEVVTIREGVDGTGYALIGPAVAKAAKDRASIVESKAKYWQFIGERRLPRQYGVGIDGGHGGARASFTFIINPPGQVPPDAVVIESESMPAGAR